MRSCFALVQAEVQDRLPAAFGNVAELDELESLEGYVLDVPVVAPLSRLSLAQFL